MFHRQFGMRHMNHLHYLLNIRVSILLTVLLIYSSCSSPRHFRVLDAELNGSPPKEALYEYSIDVPPGYKKYSFSNESRKVFLVYPDSSVIFILTDEMSSASFFLMDMTKYMESNPRVSYNEHAEYRGTKNGNWWKEELHGFATVGYANVPQVNKEKFDRAIESFRRKRK